jgi:hypothetical protein
MKQFDDYSILIDAESSCERRRRISDSSISNGESETGIKQETRSEREFEINTETEIDENDHD